MRNVCERRQSKGVVGNCVVMHARALSLAMPSSAGRAALLTDARRARRWVETDLLAMQARLTAAGLKMGQRQRVINELRDPGV